MPEVLFVPYIKLVFNYTTCTLSGTSNNLIHIVLQFCFSPLWVLHFVLGIFIGDTEYLQGTINLNGKVKGENACNFQI